MSRPAFIHVLLCDNDFGEEIEFALRHAFDGWKAASRTPPEDDLRCCIVHLAVAHHRVRNLAFGRDVYRGESLDYLNKSIRVVYADAPPALDHDGGSVAVDVNTGYIWRF